jgi:hypothetical protein
MLPLPRCLRLTSSCIQWQGSVDAHARCMAVFLQQIDGINETATWALSTSSETQDLTGRSAVEKVRAIGVSCSRRVILWIETCARVAACGYVMSQHAYTIVNTLQVELLAGLLVDLHASMNTEADAPDVLKSLVRTGSLFFFSGARDNPDITATVPTDVVTVATLLLCSRACACACTHVVTALTISEYLQRRRSGARAPKRQIIRA